jgi:hypothetical protein
MVDGAVMVEATRLSHQRPRRRTKLPVLSIVIATRAGTDNVSTAAMRQSAILFVLVLNTTRRKGRPDGEHGRRGRDGRHQGSWQDVGTTSAPPTQHGGIGTQ